MTAVRNQFGCLAMCPRFIVLLFLAFAVCRPGVPDARGAAGVCSPGSSFPAGTDRYTREIPDWKPLAGVQYSMTIHACVFTANGTQLEAPGSLLGVFKDEACMGVAEIYEGDAGWQFQLSTGSNLPMDTGLALMVYDAGSGRIRAIEESLDFLLDQTLGTLFTPVSYTMIIEMVEAIDCTGRIPRNISCPLLLQCSDPDADSLTFRIESLPVTGGLSEFDAQAGTVTYSPAQDYTGEDHFTFAVMDEGGTWSSAATFVLSIEESVLGVINVTGGNVSAVEWGAQEGATAAADPNIDHLSVGAADGRQVFFISPTDSRALKRDVRGALAGERWQLGVISAADSISLSWDTSLLPPGDWYFWELNGRNGTAVSGSAFRMASCSGPDTTSPYSVRYFAIGIPGIMSLSEIDPGIGDPDGGTGVTLSGSGFMTGARVLVDGVEASSVSVLSHTTLTAQMPAHTRGSVTVTVVNPDGGTVALAYGFVFDLAPSAVAGGPYHIIASAQPALMLDAGETSSPYPDEVLLYEWDIDQDGAYDDASGVAAEIPWEALAEWLAEGVLGYDTTSPICLRVTDSLGGQAVAMTTVTAHRTTIHQNLVF